MPDKTDTRSSPPAYPLGVSRLLLGLSVIDRRTADMVLLVMYDQRLETDAKRAVKLQSKERPA